MKRLLLALFLFSLGTIALAADSAADLARATVVIYNRAAAGSAELARFYAEARGIPDDHVVGLDCSIEEEISRQEYDETIAEPLREIFAQRKWWTLRGNENLPSIRSSSIHFMALIRGMPLKIRSTAEYAGDQIEKNETGNQNNAAVDSELAALGFFSRQISGPANNPYFRSFRPALELGAMPVMLVCRLDAPTAAIVRRMITDAVETEKSGLWGRAYVDGANKTAGGLADGDRWLKAIVKDLRRVGIPTVFDANSALFPAGFPMSDCALYYGWYAGGVAGPFTDPGFAFTPGAVAVHIHSFSASSLRSAEAGWVAPLLSRGAAVSLGNVYEPYLELTARLDIFNDRLLHGFTFAESACMSERVLSWMNVAVGDPLYRPYLVWSQAETKRENQPRNDWRMAHESALENVGRDPAAAMAATRKAATRTGNGPMLENLGLMQKELGNFSSAISYLQQARAVYEKPDDIMRTVLEEAEALMKAGKEKAALSLLRSAVQLAPDAPAAALLRKMEEQLELPKSKPFP